MSSGPSGQEGTGSFRHFPHTWQPFLGVAATPRCQHGTDIHVMLIKLFRATVERISLRGIYRAVGVGLKWLLGFLVPCVEALPHHLNAQPVIYTHDVMLQRLEGEANEMSGFVQKKANKPWI